MLGGGRLAAALASLPPAPERRPGARPAGPGPSARWAPALLATGRLRRRPGEPDPARGPAGRHLPRRAGNPARRSRRGGVVRGSRVMSDPDLVAFLQWALPRLGLRWPGFRTVR